MTKSMKYTRFVSWWVKQIENSYHMINGKSDTEIFSYILDLSEISKWVSSTSYTDLALEKLDLPTGLKNIITFRFALYNEQTSLAENFLKTFRSEIPESLAIVLKAELALKQGKIKKAQNFILQAKDEIWKEMPLCLLHAFHLLANMGKNREARIFYFSHKIKGKKLWEKSICPSLWETHYRLILSDLYNQELREDRARKEALRSLELASSDLLLSYLFVRKVPSDLNDVSLTEWETKKYPEMAKQIICSPQPMEKLTVRDLCLSYSIVAMQTPSEAAKCFEVMLEIIRYSKLNNDDLNALLCLADSLNLDKNENIDSITEIMAIIAKYEDISELNKKLIIWQESRIAVAKKNFPKAAKNFNTIKRNMGTNPLFLAMFAAIKEREKENDIAYELWSKLVKDCDEPWSYSCPYLYEIETASARLANDIHTEMLIATTRAANNNLDDAIELLKDLYLKENKETELFLHLLSCLFLKNENLGDELSKRVALDYINVKGTNEKVLCAILLSFLIEFEQDKDFNKVCSHILKTAPHVIPMAAVALCKYNLSNLAVKILINTNILEHLTYPFDLKMCELVFIETARNDLAMQCCDEILINEPDNEWALAERGKIYQIMEDLEAAISCYRQSLSVVSDYRFTIHQLSGLFGLTGSIESGHNLLVTVLDSTKHATYADLLLQYTLAFEPDRIRYAVEKVISVLPDFKLNQKLERFDPRKVIESKNTQLVKSEIPRTEFHKEANKFKDITVDFISMLKQEVGIESIHSCAIVDSSFPRCGMQEANDEELSSEQKELFTRPRILVIMQTIEENQDLNIELNRRKEAIEKAILRTGLKGQLLVQTIHPSLLWNELQTQTTNVCRVIQRCMPVYDRTHFLESIRLLIEHRDFLLNKFNSSNSFDSDYLVCYAIAGSVVKDKAIDTSDVDVWLVIDDTDVKKMTRQELKEKLRAIAIQGVKEVRHTMPYHTAADINVNIQVYILTDYWTSLRDGNPIIQTLLRDGISLYDRGVFRAWKILLNNGEIQPSPTAIEKYVKAGRDLLHRAEGKIKEILEEDIYYACLTICQAAIMTEGLAPPSPRTTADWMERIFVERLKKLTSEDISVLRDAVSLRKDIEHKKRMGTNPQNIVEIFPKATDLVHKVSDLIEERREEISQQRLSDLWTSVCNLVELATKKICFTEKENGFGKVRALCSAGYISEFTTRWIEALEEHYNDGKIYPEIVDTFVMESSIRMDELQSLLSLWMGNGTKGVKNDE